MTRLELACYSADTYGIIGEHLFARYPNFQVFRHRGNKKWFAVIMDIPRKNLGLTGEGEIGVVNLKCDTRLIGSFCIEPGIFPGWHMNKAHWLTVALDGSTNCVAFRFQQKIPPELWRIPQFRGILHLVGKGLLQPLAVAANIANDQNSDQHKRLDPGKEIQPH